MKKLLGLLFISLPFALSFGQTCGLEDTLNISPNRRHEFPITVSGIFNNDLADPNQGVCQVDILFEHQFVEKVEITLISPAGDSVEFIGPVTSDPFAFTWFATWDISFIRCAETPMPDSGYLATWDNNQANNFQFGGKYVGSYYPHIGCLEDFDSGPINGTWRLVINNRSRIYLGKGFDFRIVFCDARGPECCLSNPGRFLDTLVTQACVGDTLLDLKKLSPYYPGKAPNTLEYGYEYAIFKDSVLQAFAPQPDLTAYPAGNYQVFGLSYRLIDFPNFPTPNNLITVDSFKNNLRGPTPWMCGELTPVGKWVNVLPLPDTIVLLDQICAGDSLVYAGQTFKTPGIHFITLPSPIGCDTVVELRLKVAPNPVLYDTTATLCNGGQFMLHGKPFNTTGIFHDTLQTVAGCDSIITLRLTVLDPIVSNVRDTICAGDTYRIGSNAFTTPGIYTVPLISVLGCDSTVQLELIVLETTTDIAGVGPITCSTGSLILDASASQAGVNAQFRWLDGTGNTIGTTSDISVTAAGKYFLQVTRLEGTQQCAVLDSIIVVADLTDPVVDLGPANPNITCANPVISIGGAGTSTGIDFTYQWSTADGQFVSRTDSLFALVNLTGSYQLTVLNRNNGCSSSAMVAVGIDTVAPSAITQDTLKIDCKAISTRLNGIGSSAGPRFQYLWSSPEGYPITDANTLFPSVPRAGHYILRVTDRISGCFATDTIVVANRIDGPDIDAGPNVTINCDNPQVFLQGAFTSASGNLTLSWTGTGIGADSNALNPQVALPGLYYFKAIDNATGCASLDSTIVAIDTIAPIAAAGRDTVVNCRFPEISLGAGTNTSSGSNFTYTWQTPNGNIQGATNGRVAVADANGQYRLTVINTSNGCMASDIVLVTLDKVTPRSEAGPGGELNCSTSSIQLSGAGSTTGPEITYSWTGPGITGSINTLTTQVDSPGDYTLTVQNSRNGCSATDIAAITLDPSIPVASLPATATVDCITGNILLDGSGSTVGSFQWYKNDQPVSLGSLTPTVKDTGVYTLVVKHPSENCFDTAQIIVSNNCQPVLSLASQDTINCYSGNADIQLTVAPAGPNYDFSWAGPSGGCIVLTNSNTSSVRCGGLYKVVATNPATGQKDSLDIVVETDTIRPVSDPGQARSLNCLADQATIGGTGSSTGPEIKYFWKSFIGDTIGGAPQIIVSAPGFYALEVLNTRNGCSDERLVNVTEERVIPTIDFGKRVIPCGQSDFTINPSVEPIGYTYSYSWQGPGITGNPASPALTVNLDGKYFLTVTNMETGCTTTDSASIFAQECQICVNINEPDTLFCTAEFIELDATLCEVCNGCTFLWSTVEGSIVSGGDLLNPRVTKGGVYTLRVTNPDGKVSSNSVEVIDERMLPEVEKLPDVVLNCLVDQQILGDSAASTNGYQYSWQTASGNPVNLVTVTSIRVSQPDSIFLMVLDPITNCRIRDTASITIDTIQPSAQAVANNMLTCENRLVSLDGSGSQPLNAIRSLWVATQGGNIVAGASTSSPLVSAPGTYILEVTNTQNGCVDFDSVTITQDTLAPILQPIAGGILNCRVDSMALVGNTPSPTGFSYEWSFLPTGGSVEKVSDSLNVVVKRAGNYLFKLINNANGCENNTQVNILSDQQVPQINAGNDQQLNCNQNDLTLSATSSSHPTGLTYSWSGPANLTIDNPDTPTPTIHGPGVFTVLVTNPANFCAAQDSVRISLSEDSPEISLATPGTVDCRNEQIELSASATTLSNQAQYQWSTLDGDIVSGLQSLRPIVRKGGMYTLVVTDPVNNCSATSTVLVSENSEKPVALLAGAENLIMECNQTSLSINASPSNTPNNIPLKFSWSALAGEGIAGDSSKAIISVNKPGVFSLLVVDETNGCSDSLAVTVISDPDKPNADILQPGSLNCFNPTLDLDAGNSSSGSNFRTFWQADNRTDTLGKGPQLSVSVPGVYQYTVIDIMNNCISTDWVEVKLDTLKPTVFIRKPQEINCDRLSVVLDGSASSRGPNYTYQWEIAGTQGNLSGNTTGQTATADAAGIYRLVLTNSQNGCSADKEVEILAQETPIDEVHFSIAPQNCKQDSPILLQIDSVTGGSAPILYSINGGPFSGRINYNDLLPGNYALKAMDSNGCDWETSLDVPENLGLSIDLGPDRIIVQGDSLLISPVISGEYDRLIWQSAEVVNPQSNPDQILKPLETTTYSLKAISKEGCEVVDFLTITVQKILPVFVPTGFTPNGDGQNDVLQFFAGETVANFDYVKIFDRWGNLVFFAQDFLPNDPAIGWNGTLDGRPLDPAVFVLYAKVTMIDGREERFHGDVALIR